MGTLVNGIKEIFATSQSTATHLPVCASDGTPQGRISVGDLASVLGGLPYRTTYYDTDQLDTIFTNGIYYFSNTGSLNMGPASLVVFKWASGERNYCQIITSITGQAMKIRFYSNSQWQSWQTINRGVPEFYKNYSDLASLVTGLVGQGVAKYFSRLDAGSDLNNIKQTGFYAVGMNADNKPEQYCALLVINATNTEVYQLAFSLLTGNIYTRGFGSSWSVWHKFKGTSM